MSADWKQVSERLAATLGTDIPAMAISFHDSMPDGVNAFEEPMPAPSGDGRTGRVAAGCVFWMHGTDAEFSTVKADHANCSVGSLTHGFVNLDEVGGNEDVAALLESGWVTMDVVPQIPVITKKPEAVVYGPLAASSVEPDVVFLRLTARQVMVLSDALPGLRIEGKPQCHIVAAAKEQQETVVSVGCQLSRVRTGMPNSEITCAIPAAQIGDILDRLEETSKADRAVAAYAVEDAARFA